ncbi:MAG: toll/interleukin-1 receptor domain-containing protein [Proteobacteria bacterium]|nr:toll/interleukin-1 receptor domain-containing protein [Pseudomonadota bacterium]
MPVFISYSHQDKDFVDKLASNLVKHKARVWIDHWELHVGDSIIDRVQEAIQESNAFIIVISKSSMESEWCKKELSSGFLGELEERRVVVLPLLLEECEMPIFLRGKMYADFRHNFDEGLNRILEAIAVTSDTQGRFDEKPDFHTDWSMDWGFINNDHYVLRFTFVDHGKDAPHVILTEISILADEAATARYKKHAKNGWADTQ